MNNIVPVTNTKTATFVKFRENFQGDAREYILSEPIISEWGCGEEYSRVVCSAVNSFWVGTETYIFGIKEDGKIDWTELPGSQKGICDPEKALEELGYVIVENL